MRYKVVAGPLYVPGSESRVRPSIRRTRAHVSSVRPQGVASNPGRISTMRDRDAGRGGIQPLSKPQQSSREIRVLESPPSASFEQWPLLKSDSSCAVCRAAAKQHEGVPSDEMETSTVSWASARQRHAAMAGYTCATLRTKAKTHPIGLYLANLKPALLLIPIV